MWLSLFGAVLVLAITFFLGLQGLFSSVIMCLLTVLCAGLAFGLYENVYYGFLLERMPNHGEAVALVAIFAISLLLLRTATDSVIKGNMVMPVWVDRIGGGAFGFVTALIVVGMIQIGFQMLPFEPTFLGFNRFVAISNRGEVEEPEELKQADPATTTWQRRSLTFKPDEFAVRVASLLSDGVLRGANRFRDVHPDYMAQVQNARSGVQRESNRVATNTGALSVLDPVFLVLKEGDLLRPRIPPPDARDNPRAAEGPTPPPAAGFDAWEWRAYRVKLNNGAFDPDEQVRFRAPQVRIVGREKGRITEYNLKAVQREADPSQYVELFRLPLLGREEFCDVNRARGQKTDYDFVFEVPKDFEAHFIEFKRTARADVSDVKRDADATATGAPKGSKTTGSRKPDASKSNGKPGPKADAGGQRGTTPPSPPPDRISGVRLVGKKPVFDDKLPLPLTTVASGVNRRGNVLVGGHIIARLADQKAGDKAGALDTFDVPDDHRLLFVSVEELDPQSFLGQIRGSVQRRMPTLTLALKGKGQIKPAGKYAITKVGNEEWLECWYLDEDARNAERDIPEFDKLKHDFLTQPGTEYVYLFLVPKGSEVSALARNQRPDIPLEEYNLVAK